MNAIEQRRQRTVAERVDQHAADVQFVLERFDERLFDLATKQQETRREVNELRQRLPWLGRRVDELSDAHATLAKRLPSSPNTFRARLCWLVLGR